MISKVLLGYRCRLGGELSKQVKELDMAVSINVGGPALRCSYDKSPTTLVGP